MSAGDFPAFASTVHVNRRSIYWPLKYRTVLVYISYLFLFSFFS